MKKKGVLVFCCLILAVSAALADLNTGNEEIVIPGGKPGDVAFPHRIHQNTLKECNICHSMFGQQSGAIKTLISDGSLKPKQVMEFCRDCHRQKAAEGQAAGPTSCKGCHSR